MKKVVFYVDSLRKGGAERVVSTLANFFSTIEDYDVYIFSLMKCKIEYSLNSNVKVFFISDSNNYQNKNIFRRLINVREKIKTTKNLLKKINPDVVISFLPSSSFLALLTKKTKVIISVRNDPNVEYAGLKNKLLMKLLYPKCDGAVFQTSDAEKYFNNIIKNRIVIYNPLSHLFLNKKIDRKEKEKTIVSVGRLEKQKNFDLLINAFSLFEKKNPDYKLIIYGEGNERNKLQEKIRSCDLENKVVLTGQVDDIQDKIINSSLFVMSSNFEGMPNALIEAMALGIPCISTDCPCGGPRELINSGENGILVPTNDEIALSTSMDKVINDEKLAKKISENGLKIRDLLDEERICLKWKKYIEEV